VIRHLYSGKVRDLYETETGDLLLVASDRISAFDHVLPTPIPDKGRILTALSLWWFEQLSGLVPNHVLSAELPPALVAELSPDMAGRAVLCRRLEMVPVECVARGYLTGSGLADYRSTGAVCAVALPAGLTDGSRLPEAIFTPATKAPRGQHDENISYGEVERLLGAPRAARLRELTLAVYALGAEIARSRGIVIADTKLEFGSPPGSEELLLADEVLTPDSSRFWPAATWQPGRPQPSYDKQFVRDWLTSSESGWDRNSGEPPPPLPVEVVEATRARYVAAYERLTGLPWPS